MNVAIQEQEKMAMNSNRKAQIEAQTQTKIQLLIFNKALTRIPAKYSNYSNIFLAKNRAELPKNTEINEHTIKLEEGK